MANESKQKINKSEFQALIDKSDRQERRSIKIEFAKAFLLPLTLAVISVGATWSINKQQWKNAEHLATEQIKSALIIADANRNHSNKIFKSNQSVERIKHINGIFQAIITGKPEDYNANAMIMQIRSLEVYEGEALSFLLNIREHFKNQRMEGVKDSREKLVTQTDKSILNILKNSQIDVTGTMFVNAKEDNPEQTEVRKIIKGRKPLKINEIRYKELIAATNDSNMRKQTYDNYNFSNCIFINTKLYQANFSSCTLKNSIFMDVDLQEASFSGSDLSGAVFINCNLKRVNFMKTKVRDTVFFNPILKRRDTDKNFLTELGLYCELEDARFALGTLLKLKSSPFNYLKGLGNSKMEKESYNVYVNLLIPHEEKINVMEDSEDREWVNLKTQIGKDYSTLSKNLLEEKSRLIKHSVQNLKKDAALASTIQE